MRRKTKRSEIIDIERYCNKMLANEAKRDKDAQEDRESIEIPLSDREYHLFGNRVTTEECIFDPETSIMDWPEMIDDKRLYRAIKSLSEKEQHILYYYAVCGHLHKEIASILACPRQSITRIIRKCRKHIKAALSGPDIKGY